MMEKFNLLFLTLLNTGKLKYAPGTFASLITCLFFLLFYYFFSIIFLFFLTIIIFLYSFIAINSSFDAFNSDDPQEIVIDEVVGQMLPLLAIPLYETLYPAPAEYYCVLAFIFFRVFDIWKPFPVSYVDNNVEGAFGIMLDDIIAGVFTIIIISIIFFFIGGLSYEIFK